MASSSWQDAPTVTIFVVPAPPAPCPQCGYQKSIITRTDDNGDGSSTRKCVCKRCSSRFKVVVEIAKLGNVELDPSDNASTN